MSRVNLMGGRGLGPEESDEPRKVVDHCICQLVVGPSGEVV